MREYELTLDQQRAWAEQVGPRFERGARTRVARALADAKQGDLASWKTRLTGFVRGEPRALQAVFGETRRRRAVAQALGVDEAELGTWLARARGLQVDDDPFNSLVPGFEEFGPVPAHSMPVLRPVGYTAALDLGDGPTPRSGHNHAWPSILGEQLVGRSSRVGHVVWIVGPPGSGKTALLRAGASALREAGEQVSFWGRVAGPWSVLVCDDVDRLEPYEREQLRAAFDGDGGRVLLLATSEEPRPELTAASHLVVTIAPMHIAWAREVCERMVALAKARWAYDLELAALLRWLEEDPLALSWIPSSTALGVVIRLAGEGRPLPPDLPAMLERSMLYLARRARVHGDEASAMVLEHVGAEALAMAARRACRDGAGVLALPEIAGALVEAATGRAGALESAWKELGAPGMLAVAERLCRLGVLAGPTEALRVVSPVLLGAALGRGLVQDGVDPALLAAVVLRPEWHLALLAAAQCLRDIAPLLRALFALPPARRCQALDGMLLVLALGVRCSEPVLLQRAYRLCLAWWLRATPTQRVIRLTLSPRVDASEHEFQRPNPFLQLAAAATHHRAVLPAAWDVDALLTALPAPLDAYAQQLDLPVPSRAEALDRLAVAAPWCGDRIFDPAFWARLPPFENRSTLVHLSVEDAQSWWIQSAAPRFAEHPEGMRRMLGLIGGLSIVSAMGQGQRGTAIWQAALSRALREDGERALPAWCDALGFTLERGGLANLQALQASWKELPGSLREPIGESSARTLLGRVRTGQPWFDALEWLIADVIPTRLLGDLWRAFEADRSGDMLWRSFLSRGIPDLELLRWALKTRPTRARDVARSAQGLAIAALLDREDLAVLVELALGRSPWREEGMRRLCARRDGPARAARLRIAADVDASDRARLLSELVADSTPEEARVWRRLARCGCDGQQTLSLYFVADVASGDQRWPLTVAAIHYLGALVGEDPAPGRALGRWMRLLPRGARIDSIGLRAELRPTLATRLLTEVAGCLRLAERLGRSATVVVAALLARTELLAFVAGGWHTPIWIALHQAVDEARWLNLLERVADPSLLQARVGSLLGQPWFDRCIVERPRLVEAAAEYLASPSIRIQAPWLLGLCEMLPTARLASADKRLWGLCLAHTGLAGAERLAGWLAGMAPTQRRMWWSAVLPRTPEGVARDAVLRALFEGADG